MTDKFERLRIKEVDVLLLVLCIGCRNSPSYTVKFHDTLMFISKFTFVLEQEYCF